MIYRILFAGYRLVSSARYWVTRRFRPAGLALLGGLLVAGGMGVDTTQNVAHKAFVFLAALVAVGMAGSIFFRGRFVAERLLPRFGSVGAPLAYRVLIRNLTARPQRGLMLLESLADSRPSLAEFTAQFKADAARTKSFRLGGRPRSLPRRMAVIPPRPVPALPPRGTAEVRMELTPLRRGVVRFTALTVARPDPLGVFQAFVTVPARQSVLVLPKRYPLPPLALPGTRKYQQGGVAQAASIGESEEFVGLRDYRPGDPLRRIHWKSWAKVGTPVVKEFQDEFFVRHALILDTFLEAPGSLLFEEAVSVAASLACTIRTQDSLLDLMFVGPRAFCLTAGRGLAHADQMLEILASVRPCREQPFAALQQLVVEHAGVLSGCVVVLLAWDQARRELIARLRHLNVPMVVLVIVEEGLSATLAGASGEDRPERFHVLEVGKIEAGLAGL